MRRFLVWLGLARIEDKTPSDKDSIEAAVQAFAGEEVRMSEVTMSFQVIHGEIEQATEVAKKAKESACRISETIGLPPVIAKRA